MIIRKPHTLLPLFTPSSTYICTPCRRLHKHVAAGRVPAPTPFVPNTSTFLTLIGRELSKHSSKFTSWNELFTLSSLQLKELGIEPARSRRYLLRWREKFRKGEFGIGGDLRFVEDGVGELRVVEVPKLVTGTGSSNEAAAAATSTAGSQSQTSAYISSMQKLIINVPPNSAPDSLPLQPGESTATLRKPAGLKLLRGHAISGSYIEPVAGSNGSVARLRVVEGMWEHRRGHKVDGGERRQAEVRFKRGVEERKKASD
jgi:hypothetical protein